MFFRIVSKSRWAGANTPTHTPKPLRFYYINMNVIGQRKKKRALFIRPFWMVSDDIGFDLGGGGGSRTRVRKYSLKASTCIAGVLFLALLVFLRQNANQAS